MRATRLIHQKFQLEQVPSLPVFFAYSARASGWGWYSPQRLHLGGFAEIVAVRSVRVFVAGELSGIAAFAGLVVRALADVPDSFCGQCGANAYWGAPHN